MNSLKASIVVLLLLMVTVGFAQKVSPKLQEKFDAQLSEMTEVMSLDESQQTKVKELITNVHFERQKVRSQYEKGSDEFKKGNKDITQKYHDDLRVFCSNAQMKALFTSYRQKQANKK